MDTLMTHLCKMTPFDLRRVLARLAQAAPEAVARAVAQVEQDPKQDIPAGAPVLRASGAPEGGA